MTTQVRIQQATPRGVFAEMQLLIAAGYGDVVIQWSSPGNRTIVATVSKSTSASKGGDPTDKPT